MNLIGHFFLATHTLDLGRLLPRHKKRDTIAFFLLSSLYFLTIKFHASLDLDNTAATGDVREIGKRNFSALELEQLTLPSGVYGGCHHQFQSFSDAPDASVHSIPSKNNARLYLTIGLGSSREILSTVGKESRSPIKNHFCSR